MESENNMNYKKVIESILFVSGEPVHIDVISNAIDKEIRNWNLKHPLPLSCRKHIRLEHSQANKHLLV